MKDYEERYKRIVNSEWFKKIYHDKSLGECPVEIPELEESEEEKIRQFLINEVSETSDEIMAYRNMDKNSVLNWLNSLKGRVQPQPKQEWSEEDESFMLRAIAVIGWAGSSNNRIINTDGASELQSWLKSLKPQSHWKPTKDQMEIIEMVLTDEAMDDNVHSILKSLYSDLQKLM